MPRLYLLRHAKSDWEAGSSSDHDRPLAPRGRAAARLIGRFLTDLGQEPDAVVASTALRARSTAELAASAGAWQCSIRTTDNLYLPTPAAILSEARKLPNDVKRLVLVGHEPAWSEAVGLFAGHARVRMVTAALARLDFSGADWSSIDFGEATLAWLVTPKLLGVAEN